jgi:putative inorganic carbon (hco3(-)) transporter
LETFAFAYYMYRPIGHNMTSEWQFLYNKAHNEFLNYLATTGTVGIATYLFMIGSFYYISLKQIYKKRGNLSSNEFLIFSIIIGYSTILVTNFGGFSVVIINIFFYLFPALVLIQSGLIDYDKSFKLILSKNQNISLGMPQKISIGVTGIIGIYLIYTLITFWNADRYYYFGYNYDRAGDYQKAYTFLKMAIDKRPSEPVFKDEFAYNNAVLGTSLISQIQKTQTQQQQEQTQQIAKQLIQTALTTEDQMNTQHPNNIVFWKTKVRILYILAQVDQSYLPQALEAIKKSAQLAPTDVDVSYNLGVLYGQNGDFKTAVKTLENTIKLKPDYKGGQAYYALAIFYHQLAVDSKGKVVNQKLNQKAIDQLKLMEKLFGPNQQTTDALKIWGGK